MWGQTGVQVVLNSKDQASDQPWRADGCASRSRSPFQGYLVRNLPFQQQQAAKLIQMQSRQRGDDALFHLQESWF